MDQVDSAPHAHRLFGAPMSFIAKVLPFVTIAALITACSDVSSPTQAFSAPESARASKGGTAVGGGGGGGGGGAGTPIVVATPPTVNATGTWVGTTDGPDVTHTYTFFLTQTAAGTVSGSAAMKTPFETGFWLVVGTVHGDTLSLSEGPGTVSPGSQLLPFYRGIIQSGGSRLAGGFLVGGSPLTLFKQ
jgi:hypothetical protein